MSSSRSATTVPASPPRRWPRFLAVLHHQAGHRPRPGPGHPADSVVSRAGGSVEVTSAPGVETTFCVRLPVSDGRAIDPAAPAPTARATTPSAGRERPRVARGRSARTGRRVQRRCRDHAMGFSMATGLTRSPPVGLWSPAQARPCEQASAGDFADAELRGGAGGHDGLLGGGAAWAAGACARERRFRAPHHVVRGGAGGGGPMVRPGGPSPSSAPRTVSFPASFQLVAITG